MFSASENTFRPTAMMFRNLAALAVEEPMRGQPIDGAVLLVGCDKTTPIAADGRGVDRPALDRRHRRADAERLFPRRARRLGHASVEVLRSREGRRDDAGRVPRSRSLDVALVRHLQHDGHGLDHGVDGRGARHGAFRQCRDPGRRQPPPRDGAAHRPPHRADGQGRPEAVGHPDQAGLRERHPHQWRDRRLDQCGDPSAGHRRPRRRRPDARRLGPLRPRRRRRSST